MIFLNTDAAAVNLGERIALLRDRQKMSQNELAERIKTSQNTIHKIESGLTKRSGYIPAIAAALGLTTEELLSEQEISEPATSPLQAKLIRKIQEADEETLTEIEEVLDAVLKIAKIKKKA